MSYRYVKPCSLCGTRIKPANSARCRKHQKPMAAASLANLKTNKGISGPERDLSARTIDALLTRYQGEARRWRATT